MDFQVKPPTKRLKEICAKLGDNYSVRLFDLEQVIYRDFGNGYDVEVSGLNHNRNEYDAVIYVWRTEPNSICETIKNIHSFEAILSALNKIEAKYSDC